jgi:integrase/recombinase XerD
MRHSGNNGNRRWTSNAEYHLTRRQLARVIAATNNARDRVLLRLLAETGIRRSEAVALNTDDLCLQESTLIVRHGKGDKSRLIPVTSGLARELEELCDSREDSPVFRSRLGRRLSTRQVNRIVAGAGERADVQHPNPGRTRLTCHVFRHTFARLWKDAGGSIETLSYVLGHASQSTTLDMYGREGIGDVRNNYAETIRKMRIQTRTNE